MSYIEEMARMEAALAERRLTPTALCRLAGIASSNWGRWRRGSHAPNMRSWQSVKSAFERLRVDDAA